MSGQDMKKETRIGANLARFARSANRICGSSLAFPSERTGGVAIASAPALASCGLLAASAFGLA